MARPAGTEDDGETEPAGGSRGGDSPGGITDLHTHLMPAVDDGARDPEEAAEAAARLHEEGVERAVATPHLPASACAAGELGRRMDAFDAAWERLLRARDRRCPGLRLERGVELRLNVPDPPLSDPRLRLAGGRSVLVEFDHFRIPPHGARQLGGLAEDGWRPVLAHPERYMRIEQRMEDAVPTWREAGAALLVNAGSLLGAHGPTARTAARELLRRGWIDALASDYHARGDVTWAMAEDALREMDGGEQADLLTRTNPRRILDGERALPVPPLAGSPSVWKRFRRWLA